MADVSKMLPGPHSPLFWILVAGGVGLVNCRLMRGGLMVLGAFANDTASSSATTSSPSTGSEWLVATEIARGSSLTQPLTGGRWVAIDVNVNNSSGARATSSRCRRTPADRCTSSSSTTMAPTCGTSALRE